MIRFLASLSLAAALLILNTGCSSGSKKVAANAQPAGQQPQMTLPPGWTEADMQAFAVAATPGKEHEHLQRDVGVWKGKNTMWMYPGAEPVVTDVSCTIRPMMDGRYTSVRWEGEMPGAGKFDGFGLQGYDNVAKRFVNVWIDNHSTTMMHGVGNLSPDGNIMTWDFTYQCPINNKPASFRQVETNSGNTKRLDMFGADPKTGQEFKMMTIEMTKRS